jgi:hypothetical protein
MKIVYITAHTFYHSDILDMVYLSNPNLPIRCEIRNTGTTAGAYLDQICSTVISEGGYSESGINFGVNSGTTLKAINTASDIVPVFAVRLKNTFQTYPNRVFVRAESVDMYASGNPVYWSLVKLSGLANITLSSATWTSAGSLSAVEYNLTATAFTGGYQVAGGYRWHSVAGWQRQGDGGRFGRPGQHQEGVYRPELRLDR